MRNNDEMERWRLGEIERELLEIAARARVSTADHAAALMAELQRIKRAQSFAPRHVSASVEAASAAA